jgi:hypothetical protein
VKKIYSYAILCILLIGVFHIHAQQIQEGFVTFTITYDNISEEMKPTVVYLPQEVTIFFKNGKVRAEWKSLAGISVVLSDSGGKHTYALSEMLGKKIAMESITDKIYGIQHPLSDDQQSTSILLRKKKKIAGIACKSIKIKSTWKNKPQEMIFYYTEQYPSLDIVSAPGASGMIKGLLFDYTLFSDEFSVRFLAKSTGPGKYSDGIFQIPSGYEVIPVPETNH